MSAISGANNNGVTRKNSEPIVQLEEWRVGYVTRMVNARTGIDNGGAPNRYAPITRVVLQVNNVSQRLSQSTGALPDYPGKSPSA
jgi:hypothetical protein